MRYLPRFLCFLFFPDLFPFSMFFFINFEERKQINEEGDDSYFII